MKCPTCGTQLKDGAKFCTSCGYKLAPVQQPVITAAEGPAPTLGAPAGIFQHDKYLVMQPILRVRDVYRIFDEHTNELLYAQRLLIALKRHISIFTDESRTNEILKIFQDQVFMILYAWYTLKDANGTVLARFRRRNLMSIFRRTWDVMSPEGQLLGTVMEDSWGKALFRRFGPLGEWFKTDFIFEFGGRVIGKYIRKWTIEDKYILDLTDDPGKSLDRRIAIAMGILLDTGEMR